MNTVEYKLKGTRRKAGAIGKPDKFNVTVHRNGVMSPVQAMNESRKSMYEDGYENILFTACYIRKGRKYEGIPMLKALGLE